MKQILALLGAAALALSATASYAASKWDMPEAYAATNYHSENNARFAKCVTDGTGGKLNIVTHPGGSLFSGNDIMRAVQTGQAPIGERLISAQANENPIFGVDSIPFLATSFDQSDKLWKAAIGPMKAALDHDNLVYLYSVPWPPQGLYTKKPVDTVADLKGVKFRAYNAATARIAELAGMVPVQIEAADLSQALATGVADAFISSGSTGYDRKVWEQLNYFYDIQAWLPRNIVFANKDAWNSLEPATQKIVTNCAQTAAKDGEAKAKELTDFYLKELAKHGMKVSKPSPTLERQFKGFGEVMTKEWLKKAGVQGKAIIDAYKAM